MKSGGEKGAALVEFALVLLPLLLLLVGTADVGLLIYNQQILTNASREGARVGAAMGAGAETAAREYCRNPRGGSGWQFLSLAASAATTPRVIVTPSTVFQTDYIVRVEYDYTFLLPQLFGFDEQMTLSAETTMKVERRE